MIGTNTEMHRDVDLIPVQGAESGPMLPGSAGGVRTSSGERIDRANLWRHYVPLRFRLDGTAPTPDDPGKSPFGMLTKWPDQPENEEPEYLTGHYIFAGYLFDHFGHFILESLSRLWFIKQHPDQPIVWLQANGPAALADWQRAILKAHGVTNPVHIVSRSTRVERLTIPHAGFMIQTGLTAAQRDALPVVAGKVPEPGKRVWVSRSKLDAGRYLNDDALEGLLERAGWTIFHPQDHALEAQLAMYQDAERIAGVAGSALHTLMFISGLKARVDVFTRGRLLSQNFTTIASECGFTQHEHYVPGFLWSEHLPGWLANYKWLSLDPVLAVLDCEIGEAPSSDQPELLTQIQPGQTVLIVGQAAAVKAGAHAARTVQLIPEPAGRTARAVTGRVFHITLEEAVLSGLFADTVFDLVVVAGEVQQSAATLPLIDTLLSDKGRILLEAAGTVPPLFKASMQAQSMMLDGRPFLGLQRPDA